MAPPSPSAGTKDAQESNMVDDFLGNSAATETVFSKVAMLPSATRTRRRKKAYGSVDSTAKGTVHEMDEMDETKDLLPLPIDMPSFADLEEDSTTSHECHNEELEQEQEQEPSLLFSTCTRPSLQAQEDEAFDTATSTRSVCSTNDSNEPSETDIDMDIDIETDAKEAETNNGEENVEKEAEPLPTGGRRKKVFSSSLPKRKVDHAAEEMQENLNEREESKTIITTAALTESLEHATETKVDEEEEEEREFEEPNVPSDPEHAEKEDSATKSIKESPEEDQEKMNTEHTNNNEKEGDKMDQTVLKKEPEFPDEESLVKLVDRLFVNADKDSVTVGDIVRSVETEFAISLTKPIKKMVRNRLKSLMLGEIEPSVPEEHPESEDSDDQEEALLEESSSSEEEQEDASDYEEEEERKPVPKRKKKKKQTKQTTTQPTKTKTFQSRHRTTRQASNKKPSHVRIHAEMLRKKRMEELRVRNEELQLAQSKQDQERAELIARKFETDTEELQRKRLEDRLDLLHKLDQKRRQVIALDYDTEDDGNNFKNDAPEESTLSKEPPQKDDICTTKEEEPPSVASTEDSSEQDNDDSDSDCSEDELELEIVGGGNTKKFLPSISAFHRNVVVGCASTRTTSTSICINQTPLSSRALSILEFADNNKLGTKKSSSELSSSPGKSLGARQALRKALQAKQRKAGNMWLARELGYKTEEDHLQDCRRAEQQKREKVMKKEEERLRANRRAQLRERFLLDGSEESFIATDNEQANLEEQDNHAEEIDEEMAMAKEIENEKEQEEEEKAWDNDSVSSLTGAEKPAATDLASMECSSSEAVEVESDRALQREGENAKMTCNSEAETRNVDDENEVDPDKVLADENSIVSMELPAHDKRLLQQTNKASPITTENNEDATSERVEQASTEKTETATADITTCAPLEEASDGLLPYEGSDDEEENEFKDDPSETTETSKAISKKPRNAAWQAMLQKEADQLKNMKKDRGGNKLVEAEADEEEEEEAFMGLEDFGFSLGKKKKSDDDDEEAGADEIDEEDLKNIVDDVSDDEGDEEAGEVARKALESKEEKERHKDMLRRMRDGYDGRRGGIAGAGVGARGMHRFDQLVAADNREDAKRLGLLNDDEIDSEDDKDEKEMKGGNDNSDEIEDETALLDKMLKDRFLNRSSTDLEENFSEDEADEEEGTEGNDDAIKNLDEDEKEQERLAKRFAKRARMQRLLETYGEDDEFTQSRLIDEDNSMKIELKKMKNVLARNSRQSSTASTGSALGSGNDSQIQEPSQSGTKRQQTEVPAFGGNFLSNSGKLSLALKASRRSKQRTSFLGGSCKSGTEVGPSVQKNVALNHVVFHAGESQLSKSCMSLPSSQRSTNISKRKRTTLNTSTSLWSKVSANSFKKRR